MKEWKRLVEAALVANKQHKSSRWVQLATSRLNKPEVRTVVFRGFWKDGESLMFTTDGRSGLTKTLTGNPVCEICWYFLETWEQFRLAGKVTVLTPTTRDYEDAVAGTWKTLPMRVKLQIGGPYGPGTDLKSVEEQKISLDEPSLEDPPEQFRILLVDPDMVDHLNLKSSTRRIFIRNADVWTSVDVVP